MCSVWTFTISSTLALQRERCWISSNNCMKKIYSRVDLCVECGCSWEGDGQSTPFVWYFSSMNDGILMLLPLSSPLVYTDPMEKTMLD